MRTAISAASLRAARLPAPSRSLLPVLPALAFATLALACASAAAAAAPGAVHRVALRRHGKLGAGTARPRPYLRAGPDGLAAADVPLRNFLDTQVSPILPVLPLVCNRDAGASPACSRAYLPASKTSMHHLHSPVFPRV
eukprot:350542-Chlamydomonas_euryale.AAC.6